MSLDLKSCLHVYLAHIHENLGYVDFHGADLVYVNILVFYIFRCILATLIHKYSNPLIVRLINCTKSWNGLLLIKSQIVWIWIVRGEVSASNYSHFSRDCCIRNFNEIFCNHCNSFALICRYSSQFVIRKLVMTYGDKLSMNCEVYLYPKIASLFHILKTSWKFLHEQHPR